MSSSRICRVCQGWSIATGELSEVVARLALTVVPSKSNTDSPMVDSRADSPSQLAGSGSPGSHGGSSPLSEQPHTTSAHMRTRICMGPGEAMGVPAQRRPDSADLGGAAPQKTEVRLREVDGCPPPQYITF